MLVLCSNGLSSDALIAEMKKHTGAARTAALVVMANSEFAEVNNLKLGEVSLNTNDVVRLANFYKRLLEIDNGSDDGIHQTLACGEIQLSIYNDGSLKNNNITISAWLLL